ncbi:hypothetical protein PRIC1_007657 [Phytophthora ramorum]|uniref:uncharacterized protein n=1 Tax=Phytophthora ramorum TaxID=164328 RepID=UPI00309AC0EF|nr:hypothetical protein KRP23_2180 [Phytophthora ramorum]
MKHAINIKRMNICAATLDEGETEKVHTQKLIGKCEGLLYCAIQAFRSSAVVTVFVFVEGDNFQQGTRCLVLIPASRGIT